MDQIDSKGRPTLDSMSTDDKVNEILATMRQIADALEGMGKNPMLRSMFGNIKIG